MKLFLRNFFIALRGSTVVEADGVRFRLRFPGGVFTRLKRVIVDGVLIPKEWG